MYKALTVECVKEPYWDFPDDTEEKHKKNEVITGVLVKILTQNLPSTKHKCYPQDYNFYAINIFSFCSQKC
jgi:hypothetical protein